VGCTIFEFKGLDVFIKTDKGYLFLQVNLNIKNKKTLNVRYKVVWIVCQFLNK